ncbi:MAG TPA: hypothetical protein VEA61_06890 [Allosphingosinicella sp.]|nr:hypothetical protein [Allosphingosinicella sp.]
MAIVTGAKRVAAERRFYSGMAILMILLVFAGFAPTFYLRGIVPYPRPHPSLQPSVLAHGLLFTLWMLVFWAQTALIAAGRRDLHVRLGAAGMALALAIVPLMYLVAVWQVPRANQPPFTDPLSWTAVPLSVIPAYAVLVWLGWRRRRDAQWHKRLMLGAALLMMDPAIGRLPLAPPTLGGFFAQSLLALAPYLLIVWWDRRSLGRIHPATSLVFVVAAAALSVRSLCLATGAWAPVAAHLPSL